MKEHYQDIYDGSAETYDLLVAREDFAGNLERALTEHLPLADADVVEMGMGTGRLTRMLAPQARSITGFDQSAAMLDVARRHLQESGWENWSLAVADHRELPLADSVADVGIEGWAFGHLVEDGLPQNAGHLQAALAEMERVVRPGGTLAIIETLGTGRSELALSSGALAQMYRYLEQERGFRRIVVRTDYQFASVAEAERLCRFFFGDVLGDRARDEALTRISENTGLWLRTQVPYLGGS